MVVRYTVPGGDFSQAGRASTEVKKILARLGVEPALINKAAVAMYEAEINMVIHAGGGQDLPAICGSRLRRARRGAFASRIAFGGGKDRRVRYGDGSGDHPQPPLGPAVHIRFSMGRRRGGHSNERLLDLEHALCHGIRR